MAACKCNMAPSPDCNLFVAYDVAARQICPEFPVRGIIKNGSSGSIGIRRIGRLLKQIYFIAARTKCSFVKFHPRRNGKILVFGIQPHSGRYAIQLKIGIIPLAKICRSSLYAACLQNFCAFSGF